MTPRVLVANLDVESAHARRSARMRQDAGAATLSPKDPRFALPDAVMLRLAALGTLLRCAADDGDRLWTVRTVDPARMADAPGLARPELFSGPRPMRGDVVWGEDGDAAAAANDRAFGIAVARSHAVEDLRAEMVESIEEIDALRPGTPWVLKAQHSAAGRDQVRFEVPLDGPSRRRVEKILLVHGGALVEPWLDLAWEAGALGTVTPPRLRGRDARVTFEGVHAFGVDAGRSLAWVAFPATAPDAEDCARIERATRFAGASIGSLGYAGPFGVDVRKSVEGVLFPLAEINARWTFGRVAREIARRVLPHATAWRFAVGSAPPAGAVPLLHAAPPDGVGAWIMDESEGARAPHARAAPRRAPRGGPR